VLFVFAIKKLTPNINEEDKNAASAWLGYFFRMRVE
jgi:hypothetical protein